MEEKRLERSLIHRKETLIITAIEIINELGFQGLTTKEIAKRQGVSEATLFRHYKSKNDLLLSILDFYSQYDNDIISTIRIKKMKPKQGILFFVESYGVYYQNYPEITAITQIYDELSSNPDLGDKVKEIYNQRSGFIMKMIDEAQKLGELREDISSENLADIITSTFNGICLKWRMNDYKFSLSERLLTTVNMLLEAFSL